MIDIILLVLTIYLEAECQPLIGKQAVANVIYNRSLNANKTITEIVLQPKQFSCWNSPSYVKSRLSNIDWRAMRDSFIAATKLKDDITNNSLFYATNGTIRNWMSKKIITVVISDHKFMKTE